MIGYIKKILPDKRYLLRFMSNEPLVLEKERVVGSYELKCLIEDGLFVYGVSDDDITCFDSAEDIADYLNMQQELFDDGFLHFEAGFHLVDMSEYLQARFDKARLCDLAEVMPVDYEITAHVNTVVVDHPFIGPKSQLNVKYYCTQPVRIVVHDGVEMLNDSIFAGIESLESVQIPDSMQTLSAALCMSCHNMTEFRIPSACRTIEQKCFSGCKKLRTIEFHDKLALIDKKAFSSVPIREIDLACDCMFVGDRAFFCCGELEKVHFRGSVAYIGASCFYACRNLKEIIIDETVEKIGLRAFDECEGIQTVTLGKAVNDKCLRAIVKWIDATGVTVRFPAGAECEKYARKLLKDGKIKEIVVIE